MAEALILKQIWKVIEVAGRGTGEALRAICLEAAARSNEHVGSCYLIHRAEIQITRVQSVTATCEPLSSM